MFRLVVGLCLLLSVGYSDVLKMKVGKEVKNVTWSSACTKSNADGSVKTVVFEPDPPVLGQNNTIIGVGSTKVELTDGSWQAIATFNGNKVGEYGGDMCKDDVVKFPLGLGDLYYTAPPCPVIITVFHFFFIFFFACTL